ncbi:MAG: lytic transglycosylase domain-containing protein [Dissulfurispiraceae bacterium]|jgi:hypothetical protein
MDKSGIKTLFLSIIFPIFGVNAYADIYQMTALDHEGIVVHEDSQSSEPKSIVEEPHKDKNKKACPKSVTKKIVGKHGRLHRIVEEKARKHNVDPKLVEAVIRTESNWASGAVSYKGAIGIMQIMPKTAMDMGVRNCYNSEENIEGGVKYLRYLLDRFNGNVTLALAAYNAGPARVDRYGGVPTNPKTVSYVKRVMRYYSSEPVHSQSSKKLEISTVFVEDIEANLANLANITAVAK